MDSLSAFLHPVEVQEEQEVIVSRRFVGEDGKPIPFRIRALTQEENDRISKMSRKRIKDNGRVQEVLDPVEFSRRMVLAATVFPDFSSKELCDRYGVLDPQMVPGKMLRPGEYTRLLDAINTLCGFDSVLEDEAVKN